MSVTVITVIDVRVRVEAQAWANDPQRRVLIGLFPALNRLTNDFSKIRNARQLDSGGEATARLGRAEQALVQQTRKVLEQVKTMQQPESRPVGPLTRTKVVELYEKYLGRVREAQ